MMRWARRLRLRQIKYIEYHIYHHMELYMILSNFTHTAATSPFCFMMWWAWRLGKHNRQLARPEGSFNSECQPCPSSQKITKRLCKIFNRDARAILFMQSSHSIDALYQDVQCAHHMCDFDWKTVPRSPRSFLPAPSLFTTWNEFWKNLAFSICPFCQGHWLMSHFWQFVVHIAVGDLVPLMYKKGQTPPPQRGESWKSGGMRKCTKVQTN